MEKKQSKFAKNSKIAITAALMSVPLFTATNTAFAEKVKGTSAVSKSTEKHSNIFIKVEFKDCAAVGSENGKTIFKNSKGELFFLDPKTGDQKFVATDYFLKVTKNSMGAKTSGTHIKFHKEVSGSIIGLDKSGNAFMKHSNGEIFQVDPKTGDMKFTK
jgi:hypothetical protein